MSKRFRSSTSILIALSLAQPYPALAQATMLDGGICADGAEPPCGLDVDLILPDGRIVPAAEAQATADAAAEASVETEAAAEAEAAAADAAQRATAASERAAELAREAEAAGKAAMAAEAALEAAAEADADTRAALEAEAAAAADAALAADEAAAAAEAEAAGAAALAAEAAGEAEAAAAAAAEAEAALADAEAQAAAAAYMETAEPQAEPAQEAEAEPQVEAEAGTETEPGAEIGAEAAEEPEPEAEAAPETGAQAEAETEAEAEAEAGAVAKTGAEAEAEADADAEQRAGAEPAAEPHAEAGVAADTEAEAEAALQVLDLLGGALGAEEGDAGQPPAAAAAEEGGAEAAAVVETEITEADSRSSAEDFSTTAAGAERRRGGDRDGLSDFEKAALVGLGILAVGAILSNGDEVVANTGDRVVVRRGADDYYVLKDDNALLRQPGATMRTETFGDGSTRTTVTREDGSRIVTIRDAAGRVLRRVRETPDGRQVLLIDDTVAHAPVEVDRLPAPASREVSLAEEDPLALRLALERAQRDAGRSFSLRQVRDITRVRKLVPEIALDAINFETGSAAIPPSEAGELLRLGDLMRSLIEENPAEIFLIEGHTDATGSAAFNLALSDRRAESVALALTEYFDVPPENMVIQGYGESDLKIDTQAEERRNRRVAVRRITPLLDDRLARN